MAILCQSMRPVYCHVVQLRKLGVLIIGQEQMETFKQTMFASFENEMVLHSKDFSPQLCEVLGDKQLRVTVRSAITRAESYGFTNRGSIRLFIELMFLRGSAFDTDPQYPMIGKILRASGDQMQRAEQIHKDSLDYFEKVSGPGAVNLHKALRELLVFAKKSLTFSSHTFVADMVQEMTRVFPQKAAYIGDEGLMTLIHEGHAEARKYGLSTVRGETLVLLLMFAFGHGCIDDQLYPWISRTLRAEQIIDSTVRAERLEKKAKTWLTHVLTWLETRNRT